jgi:hypothetical protein
MVMECVPTRDASLGIIKDEEKLTGGFGPLGGATDGRLLVEDMFAGESCAALLAGSLVEMLLRVQKRYGCSGHPMRS